MQGCIRAIRGIAVADRPHVMGRREDDVSLLVRGGARFANQSLQQMVTVVTVRAGHGPRQPRPLLTLGVRRLSRPHERDVRMAVLGSGAVGWQCRFVKQGGAGLVKCAGRVQNYELVQEAMSRMPGADFIPYLLAYKVADVRVPQLRCATDHQLLAGRYLRRAPGRCLSPCPSCKGLRIISGGGLSFPAWPCIRSGVTSPAAGGSGERRMGQSKTWVQVGYWLVEHLTSACSRRSRC